MIGYSQTIGRVLVHENITAQLLRAKQGPMTLTYDVRLVEPNREQLNKVRSIGPVLEQYAGVGPVRVTEGYGSIVVEFPSPVPVTPSAWMLAEHGKGKNIALGFNQWGDPTYWNMARFPNLLVVGPPRSGKSSAVRSILYQAIKDSNGRVEYMIIAERQSDWGVFRNISGCMGLYMNATKGKQALEYLAGQMEEKANAGEKFDPPILIVLDDLMSLLKGDNEITTPLTKIATAGGAVGLYVILGTQTAGTKQGTGGMVIEDSFIARLVYKTQGAGAGYRATGNSDQGIEDLTATPGDAMFITGHEKNRIATGMVKDSDILEDLPSHRGEVVNHIPLPNSSPVVAKIETSENKGVPAAQIPIVTLPVIKPARKPNDEETAQIIAYLNVHPISQNGLFKAVYGGKNETLKFYLQAALGDMWDEFFPARTKFLNS